MDPIALDIQALYADLVQQVETASLDEASVMTTTVKVTGTSG